ncbi:hypothetical protein CA267_010405 [Alteromonas pelagimontana]|uniref:Uncharacterized protein n=1 Tax=Alteromonas pelagimontana TaxID=1858656 RepID=A0A6M4MD98_9ALTE|nr:hypothetical protein [Alteromonas pelagimontana]QJR81161.1 hypothetical protein CA267_010405 [Alteromonas pelagimontana]
MTTMSVLSAEQLKALDPKERERITRAAKLKVYQSRGWITPELNKTADKLRREMKERSDIARMAYSR